MAQTWGRLSAAGQRRGRTTPINDTWIAASCLAEGLPLATLNVKDYQAFAEHHGLVLITPADGVAGSSYVRVPPAVPSSDKNPNGYCNQAQRDDLPDRGGSHQRWVSSVGAKET